MDRPPARRLLAPELVQWFVTLAAPIAWTGQFVAGHGVSVAVCNPSGAGKVDASVWLVGLTAAAATIAATALCLSVLLFRWTRNAGSEPPEGRHRFFAYAGIGRT